MAMLMPDDASAAVACKVERQNVRRVNIVVYLFRVIQWN
jgi:hypothetical protein